LRSCTETPAHLHWIIYIEHKYRITFYRFFSKSLIEIVKTPPRQKSEWCYQLKTGNKFLTRNF